jgi:hypothetical protein
MFLNALGLKISVGLDTNPVLSLPVNFKAEVAAHGQALKGGILSISLDSLIIETEQKLKNGEKIAIAVFPEENDKPVEFAGIVAAPAPGKDIMEPEKAVYIKVNEVAGKEKLCNLVLDQLGKLIAQ